MSQTTTAFSLPLVEACVRAAAIASRDGETEVTVEHLQEVLPKLVSCCKRRRTQPILSSAQPFDFNRCYLIPRQLLDFA